MAASDTVKLVQASQGDAAAIQKLTREAYAKWVPLIGREPKPMVADYAEAVRKHRFDLLYVNGELAALIETISCPDHLLIENVAVSPAFQGKGFGRILMAHAETLAASSEHLVGVASTLDAGAHEGVERNAIVQMLKETGGNKLETAKRLGIGRQTLYNKIKAYGIEI